MKKRSWLVSGLVSVLALAAPLSLPQSSKGQAPQAAPSSSTASPGCFAYQTNTELTADLLKPGMLPPCAPAVTEKGEFSDIVDNLQHGFDLYSWLIFAALNSPADGATA